MHFGTEGQSACHLQAIGPSIKGPQQCSMREAVQELLQCDSSYSQEDFVSTVRPYQRDLISLPETGDDPVSLDQVLDEHGRQVLGDPLRTMLLSDEEWGEVLEKGDLVRPYMDVRLQHDQQLYTSFIQDLHAKGMISFTSRPREIAPPFFVKKKNGRLRLILDCRAVNTRFKKPPPLALGAGTSWAQVCIPEGSTLYLAQSDIKDYFYSLALPHELQSLFCLPAIAKSAMQDWGLDLDQVDCDAEGWRFPMLRVVPMGWSWAMWVAQRVHTHLCMEAGGLSLDRVIVESKAPPDLSDGEVIIIPYADNLNVAGIDEQRVQQVKNKIVDRLREIGFRVHEELEACSIGQSLGFLVDGAKGVVAPIPERLHKVRLALDWLARQPWVTGKQVERLIGHCVHFMLLRRELLSIFRAMYDFVHKSYSKKRPLFASAAREAKWASALLGLCSVDLRKDWSGRVTASDASLSGVAVCCRELPRDEVAAIGSQREPWRYKYKELPPPREAALNFGDPFSDPSTVKPLKQELEQPDPFELNEKFVEVPQNVLQPELWQEVFAVHMKHPEHITLLETRGVVISLRHKFRAVQHFGKRHLHLGDNMGMILMIAKGRSSSFSMLKLCRRLCALLLCTDSVLSPRWIPSELNVADKGSRRWESQRKRDVAGRAWEKIQLERVDSVCYPTRAGKPDRRQAASSARQETPSCKGAQDSLRQEAGRQGQDSSRDSETEIRSSSLQGTDKPGATSSVGSSGERLHQKDQRSEILCTTEQDFPSKCEELGRGLHLVSEQHLRAGRRAPRGLKVCGGGQRRVPRLWPQVSTASNDQSTSGLDKDRSSEDQTTSALGVGRRHCNEDAGTKAAPCGLGGS